MVENTVAIRERILRAAREVLQDSGSGGLRLDEVAGRAGIARPNIYRYFDGKEHLLRQVTFAEVRRIHARRKEALRDVRDGRELLVQSLLLGAQQSRTADSVVAIAGPHLEGVGALVANDSELLAVEAEYWSPVIALARWDGAIDSSLDDATIIRWFLANQFLVLTQPDLPGPDLRGWIERFIVSPILPRPHAVEQGRAPRMIPEHSQDHTI